MSVAKRIACVEKFTHAIIEKKQEVVKLIMWEIGKTIGDSTKEFDRTIEYIQATIDALKDLDRQSAGFINGAGYCCADQTVAFGRGFMYGAF
jgi:glyceraldehyde-3-phosphate dehydrogenase (NADP+)